MTRMTLAAVTSTRQPSRPIRLALFGVPGVGKTTFAAAAPAPIFLCAEDGAGFLDAKAFPKPTSWQDVHDAVQVLLHDEHDFKTLVIDTLDALEVLCWEHVCRSQPGKNRSIEDFGYGKGYVLAVEAWGKLLKQLEALQRKRGMHIVLVAHAVAREHKDPDHEAWKRWTMKLHAKSADVIAGWVDALLFAAPEMVSKKEGLKVRGFATGERLLYTEATGSHEGKNRYGLPPSMPLDWAIFKASVDAALAPAPQLLSPAERERRLALVRTDLVTLVPQLPDDSRQRAAKAVDEAGDDLEQLSRILQRVIKTLASKAA